VARGMNTQKAISKRRSFINLKIFCLSLEVNLPSSADRKGCESVTSDTESISFLYHRRLRCLVIIDLKIGKLTHADIGQIHLYLNYARAHWTHPDENPPVGLILCASKDATLAKYALEGLNNKVLAAEYKMALLDERVLVAELEKSRKKFERKKR